MFRERKGGGYHEDRSRRDSMVRPAGMEWICKTIGSPVFTDSRLIGIVGRTPGPDCSDMIGGRVVLGMARDENLLLDC